MWLMMIAFLLSFSHSLIMLDDDWIGGGTIIIIKCVCARAPIISSKIEMNRFTLNPKVLSSPLSHRKPFFDRC